MENCPGPFPWIPLVQSLPASLESLYISDWKWERHEEMIAELTGLTTTSRDHFPHLNVIDMEGSFQKNMSDATKLEVLSPAFTFARRS